MALQGEAISLHRTNSIVVSETVKQKQYDFFDCGNVLAATVPHDDEATHLASEDDEVWNPHFDGEISNVLIWNRFPSRNYNSQNNFQYY